MVRTWAVSILVGVLFPLPSSGASLEELAACLQANTPKQSSVLSVRLESKGRAGLATTHRGRLYWRRTEEGLSQTLVCMTAPRDVRGLAYLIHETKDGQALWVYLPEEERVLRVNPRAAARRARIARTAISYEDLRYLPLNLARASPEPPREGKLGERAVAHVGLGVPVAEELPYARAEAQVDVETCVPLRTELYEAPETVHKVISADPASITREGTIRFARWQQVEDLKNEIQTEVIVEKAAIDTGLEDRIFSPAFLQRGRCAE